MRRIERLILLTGLSLIFILGAINASASPWPHRGHPKQGGLSQNHRKHVHPQAKHPKKPNAQVPHRTRIFA
jgi:hypothetical protein